ncbi:MAG: amidohydrolase [Synergistaceae bacterium]|nr:amidohydrolase [Synergistaceae bacterium]
MLSVKEEIAVAVEELRAELLKLSHDIHDNPELGLREYNAVKWQKELLEKHGFIVETPFCGMETAFKATCPTNNPNGVKIAFLAEYDALDGIGHGCGHNIIAASAVGAAISLSKTMDENNISGEVVVFGTPAEETRGGKIPMADNGVFDGFTCALMIHPATENIIARHGLAAQSVDVEFFGKAAHSSSPADGVNALASMIAFFNGIDSFSHTWSNESKINGIITQGGTASNIIPDYTSASFTVRAGKKKTLVNMFGDIERIAKSAALLTGAGFKVNGADIYAERYPSMALGEAFKANMETLGEIMNYPDYTAQVGSSDIGNVSLVVPAIHEYLSIAGPGSVTAHHESFCNAAVSPRADEVVLLAAKGLAMTAADILTDEKLRARMWKEFDEKVRPNQC